MPLCRCLCRSQLPRGRSSKAPECAPVCLFEPQPWLVRTPGGECCPPLTQVVLAQIRGQPGGARKHRLCDRCGRCGRKQSRTGVCPHDRFVDQQVNLPGMDTTTRPRVHERWPEGRHDGSHRERATRALMAARPRSLFARFPATRP
eukprot:5392342-Prymnesium_polylepis.2